MILEGAPVLCKRCGAPTEVQPDLSVQCRFCGTPDRLPPDELGRVLEIKGRLAMAASRVAQLASSEAALASIFERRGAFLSVMGPFPVIALLIVLYTAFGAYSTISTLPDSVPDSLRVELLINAARQSFFVLGIAVSSPIALLVGRMSYTKNVRPKLAARPPRYAGAPMRCRACGGDLPRAREAFVACPFCRSQNILAAAAVEHAARALDEEIAGYRARANGTLTGVSTAATNMSRTMTICFVLVYLSMFVLGAVMRAVLSAVT